ncbi:glycosyltransferase family 2 protein [Qingshengfaniella alkalisoli]
MVMANYNGASHLLSAIRSVLAQSMSSLELLIADDASTDRSIEIVETIAKTDPRVRLLKSTVNSGPAAARNRALAAAQGQWIAVVDSDDLIHPQRFERLVALAESEAADGCADDLIYFHESGTAQEPPTLLGDVAPGSATLITPAMMLGGTQDGLGSADLGYLKPLIRRDRIGNSRYREDIRIGEDHEFYLRLLLDGARMILTPQSYYLYRRHAASISHRLRPEDIDAMIRVQEDLAPRFGPVEKARARLRRAALLRSKQYETCVQDIKNRRALPAAARAIRHPHVVLGLARIARARLVSTTAPVQPQNLADVHLAPLGTQAAPETLLIELPEREADWVAADWSKVSTATQTDGVHVRADGPLAQFAMGYVCVSAQTPAMERKSIPLPAPDNPLVQVRTPTYRRPDALRRCLESLVEQSHENWICDVYDDDPNGSAKEIVDGFGDPRIHFNHNRPQRFASRNIDSCFSRANPREADFFCVVEDDNYLLPDFMEENIAVCRDKGVEIIFRNQLIEHGSGTNHAQLSENGILDDKLNEGLYDADVFRLCLIADIGVSNGGLFWSRHAKSDLEIHEACSATLQEYLRTFSINEPMYVAMKPLAVWAENGEDTTRDIGMNTGYLARELSLKRSITQLQKLAWTRANQADRARFLNHPAFRYSADMRARGLVKSHIDLRAGQVLGWRETLRLALRGGLIRLLGRPERGLAPFLAARQG